MSTLIPYYYGSPDYVTVLGPSFSPFDEEPANSDSQQLRKRPRSESGHASLERSSKFPTLVILDMSFMHNHVTWSYGIERPLSPLSAIDFTPIGTMEVQYPQPLMTDFLVETSLPVKVMHIGAWAPANICFDHWEHLVELYLTDCPITVLPASIGTSLHQLERIIGKHMFKLNDIHCDIAKSKSLHYIELCGHKIEYLPMELTGMTGLRGLHLGSTTTSLKGYRVASDTETPPELPSVQHFEALTWLTFFHNGHTHTSTRVPDVVDGESSSIQEWRQPNAYACVWNCRNNISTSGVPKNPPYREESSTTLDTIVLEEEKDYPPRGRPTPRKPDIVNVRIATSPKSRHAFDTVPNFPMQLLFFQDQVDMDTLSVHNVSVDDKSVDGQFMNNNALISITCISKEQLQLHPELSSERVEGKQKNQEESPRIIVSFPSQLSALAAMERRSKGLNSTTVTHVSAFCRNKSKWTTLDKSGIQHIILYRSSEDWSNLNYRIKIKHETGGCYLNTIWFGRKN